MKFKETARETYSQLHLMELKDEDRKAEEGRNMVASWSDFCSALKWPFENQLSIHNNDSNTIIKITH